MREKIQHESSGEEPCKKAGMGNAEVDEKPNPSGIYGDNTEKRYHEQKTAGSSGGLDKSSDERWAFDKIKFSFSLTGLFLFIIWIYKKAVSPWLPRACRFTPTCSEYAAEAIVKFGVLKGSGLAVWRLLRCQPFCEGGYDPVPEPKRFKKTD